MLVGNPDPLNEFRSGGIEAVLQELGHRVDSRPQEVWQKPERHHDQSNAGHPFIAGYGQAYMAGGIAAHADELLSRDIGRNQRKADQPPR